MSATIGRHAYGTARSRSVQALRSLRMRWHWASLRRLSPLSEWGFERGTPVDRWYIESFLDGAADRVRGTVLEVKEDLYASRYGGEDVEIVDINTSNARATIHGDLCDVGTLPSSHFDTAIVTQTLQLVARPTQALNCLHQSLKPGGVLLLTVPCLSRLAGEADRWRWTPEGLRQLLAEAGLRGVVHGFGNVLTARAFLMGIGAEELPAGVLAHDDPDYPVIVTAVVSS